MQAQARRKLPGQGQTGSQEPRKSAYRTLLCEAHFLAYRVSPLFLGA